MDLTQYRKKLIGNEQERAVSPVIGVILMVAITVILAAVIAAFVLDIGDLDDPSPSAQFDSSETQNATGGNAVITFTHQSGDSVDVSYLEIEHDGSNLDGDNIQDEGELSAGASVSLQGDGGNSTKYFDEGDEISLVWDNGETSSTLATHTVANDLYGGT